MGPQGGGLFSKSSAFWQPVATPVLVATPASAPATQPPAQRRRSDKKHDDYDRDDERMERRRKKRALEAEDKSAQERPVAGGRRRKAHVQVEPPEDAGPAKKKKRRTEQEPDGARDAAPVAPPTAEEVVAKAERTVFVGNLKAETTRKRLRHLFSSCGHIESARIRSVVLDPESKMPRRAALMTGQARSAAREAVNGYIVFRDAEAVPAALALNMTLMDGRHVRVDRVAPPAGLAVGAHATARGARAAAATQQLDPKRTLYLGNVPFDADEEELIALFAPCGAIEAVRLPRDRVTAQGRGFALVCFLDKSSISAALALGASAHIRNRQLRLARASAQKAAVAASAKRARAEAAAAVEEARTGGRHMRDAAPTAPQIVAANEHAALPGAASAAEQPRLARWQRRAAEHGSPPAVATPVVRRGPAPWEGVHATTLGPQGAAAGAAAGAPAGTARVKKQRWRDLGRTAGGVALMPPSALKLAAGQPTGKGSGRLAAAKKKAKLKFRAAGVGKDGGHKRISSRKRPAVAARKAVLAKRKGT